MHGVGLCDEWPMIAYKDNFVEGSYDYHLEPGMALCVEALVSPEGGDFSIKLEELSHSESVVIREVFSEEFITKSSGFFQ